VQSPAGLVPTGAVADHYGVGAWRDLGADLFQMMAHGFGVGLGMMIAAPTARSGQIAPKR